MTKILIWTIYIVGAVTVYNQNVAAKPLEPAFTFEVAFWPVAAAMKVLEPVK